MHKAEVPIREERPEDLADIDHVNEAAFGRPAARLVACVRAHGGTLLSPVAVAGGRVVGHILFSPVQIGAGSDAVQGAGLCPMAVLPELQRRGIGSRLVAGGIRRLRERERPFVAVLGHPEYYPRLGFVAASRYGLRCPWDVSDGTFMVLPLDPSRVKPGLVSYREEFSTVT